MANDLSGLFQTLVAATTEAAGALKFQNTFLNAIYWDNEPIAASPYTQLAVNIPSVNESDVVDIGAGPLQPHDTKHATVYIALDKNFSNSFPISEFVAGRTPRKLKDDYVAPNIEALARKINRTISNLVNTTKFPNYSIIQGSGNDAFNRADVTAAWKNLADTGVPVDDPDNMFLITSTAAYGNMLGDANFINQSIVSDAAAISSQQRAKLKNLYGAQVAWDQHLDKYEAGKEPGVYMHRYAIAGLNRIPDAGDPRQVQEAVIPLGDENAPNVRLQYGYSMKDQAWMVHLNCWWGVVVARPEMGALLQTA